MTASGATAVSRKRCGSGSSSNKAHPRLALSRKALRFQGRSHFLLSRCRISVRAVRMHVRVAIAQGIAGDSVGRKRCVMLPASDNLANGKDNRR